MGNIKFLPCVASFEEPYQPPDIREMKERAFKDHELFAREFFSEHLTYEMSTMHKDFCRMEGVPDRRSSKEAIAAPRGNAKTTFKTLIKAVHATVYNYHPFIVVIGFSAAEAIDKVKDIRDELVSNEHLVEVFGKLVSPMAAKSDFTCRNGVRIVARGRGGQVRGLKHGRHRPTLIILDDIESLESVNTPEQRAKTQNWFFKDVVGAGSADKQTNVTMVGTILHSDGLLAELLKKPGWEGRKYRSIESWAKRQDLWDKWKDIYCDLSNPLATSEATEFYEANEEAMLEGTKVLWPEGEPYVRLQEYIIEFGLASFHSEKQNEPFDPESQILFPDKCPRFKVYWPHDPEWIDSLGDEGFAIVRGDNGAAIHSRDLKIVAFLDPALAKKPKSGKALKGDYAALVICGQDPHGYIYVLDVWLKKKPPSDQIQNCFILHEKWGFETLYLETVGFQELMKVHFTEYQKLWSNTIRVIGVDQYHNKQARISTLQPYLENKWILFREGLDEEFFNQMRIFPTGHDDGPDSLHGCVAKLRKPMGGISTLDKTQGEVY